MLIVTSANKLLEVGTSLFFHEPSQLWEAAGHLYLRDRKRFSDKLTYHRFASFRKVELWNLAEVAATIRPVRKRVRYKKPRIVDGLEALAVCDV